MTDTSCGRCGGAKPWLRQAFTQIGYAVHAAFQLLCVDRMPCIVIACHWHRCVRFAWCVLMVAVLQTPSQDSRPNSLGNINPAPKHAATATHRHQQHATTRERGPTTYGRVTSSRIKVAVDPVTLLQGPSPRHPLAEQTAQRREESLGATGGWPRNGGWG